jgi:hypothetical protein
MVYKKCQAFVSMSTSFTFRAGARPVLAQAKFREQTEEERISYHILVDPRLARGSVYAHHKRPNNTVQPIRYRPRFLPKPKEEAAPRSQEEEEGAEDKEFTPDLLEIENRPIEDDLATAADTYIQRPPTAHFVEEEPGVDVETQVWDGDLFNYDAEVRPMIKVIVQHTLLRALAEVHEEVEVESIQRHRDRYELERNTILAEVQRLDAKEQRKFEEQKRRMQQREQAQAELSKRNQETAANGFGAGNAADVMMQAMDLIERGGSISDEVEAEVRGIFLPWLSGELAVAMRAKQTLFELRKGAAQRAIRVRTARIATFQDNVAAPRTASEDRQASIRRQMVIEDRGAATVRRVRKEYREAKEREAVEAAARAEREAEEAAARAEREAEEAEARAAAKAEKEEEETESTASAEHPESTEAPEQQESESDSATPESGETSNE